MPGAGLTVMSAGQARPDRLALKPYWGKPAVRNFREGDGNVGIIRSPVRAIALPDLDCAGAHHVHLRPFFVLGRLFWRRTLLFSASVPRSAGLLEMSVPPTTSAPT